MSFTSLLLSGILFCLVSFYWYRRSNHTWHSLNASATTGLSAKGHELDQIPSETHCQLRSVASTRQPWEYFLVLDVEATCVPGTDFNWPNEIIEWPVVLLTWDDRDDDGKASHLKVVDEFRSFVRPTWKPILTEFCTSLTGIAQASNADVDSAPVFSAVLDNFHAFLCRNGLICHRTGQRLKKFTWATDGPFDIRDFVVKQCFISKMKMPEWLQGDVVDVRKQVAAWLAQRQGLTRKNVSFYSSRSGSPGQSLNISKQLSVLSLPPFQGRQHSGIDDTRNIARILTELARRGIRLEPNLRIRPGKRWYWMGTQIGEIYEEYFP
ncbi:hypothetical protein K439DRAFT_1403650 [Ramaria rubella]|nr:hypothetical protein K439DRAFT_1403650 [Ramaria rubella]